MPAAPGPRELGFYFALSQVGLEMAAPPAVGVWLDGLMGWSPWGVVVGAILGLVGGFGHLVLMLNRREREIKQGKDDADQS